MTEEQYKALRNLYHHHNAAFWALPDDIVGQYYERLYQGKKNS